jgi:acyl-CoA synthetase (AMP-forming)/AMP-acid ligase II
MSITARSIPELLRVRATEQPDATAYTFIDYDLDPNGFAETLTWSQVHQRAVNVAEELRLCGSAGDRAAILAPQGLEYVIAFFGALEAGFIAVPLPVPLLGAHDERVSAALRNCAASVILTTSSTVDVIAEYARADGPKPAPSIIEIDSIDLDLPRTVDPTPISPTSVAYLQYTSGSTGQPSGAMVSHSNFLTNIDQAVLAFFEDRGKTPPVDTTFVSWLPFYHDMGLVLGIGSSLAAQLSAVLTSPIAFLQRPARWLHALADTAGAFSAAPNFAFDLAARRTSDDDMAGRDLGTVLAILDGSERVHGKTIARFNERFERFNLSKTAVRPSYGLAEATLYVAASKAGQPYRTSTFKTEQLSAGQATRCDGDSEGCTELVAYHLTGSPLVRIVDGDTNTENQAGTVGEIWVHGDNVGLGYWGDRTRTDHTFGARLVAPTSGTPEEPWLRTGDLGVICDGELFIIGRIKDLLVVNGRNHYPDDIEATIQEITKGKVAAISVSNEETEQLVTIVELKDRRGSATEAAEILRTIRRELTSAISESHGLRISDLVLVPPGSIPVTTSGKIRRSSCVERYQQGTFERLDV